MKRVLGVAIGGIFLMSAAGAYAAPGDCFNGGTPPGCGPNCAPNSTTCSAEDLGCVSNTKGHAKCGKAIATALFGKLIPAVIKCHAKQAAARLKGADQVTAGDAEETCEQAAKAKLDAALAKVSSICDPSQNSHAGEWAAILVGHPSTIPTLSLDNGFPGGPPVYCDSAGGALIEDTECEGGTRNGVRGCATAFDCPGGGKCVQEDAGYVPKDKNSLKCEDTEGKEIGKLVAAVTKCHIKMDAAFAAGKPFDEEACEEGDPVKPKAAHRRYNAARDVMLAKGICPACNDAAHWDANAANAIGTLDAVNANPYPCNLTP
jgi:hypothetical protein